MCENCECESSSLVHVPTLAPNHGYVAASQLLFRCMIVYAIACNVVCHYRSNEVNYCQCGRVARAGVRSRQCDASSSGNPNE